MRKELVKEAAINLPLVYVDISLLAQNELRLEGASPFTKQTRPLHLFVRTPDLQGTDA